MVDRVTLQIVVCIIQDVSSPNRTLDLASALEIGPAGARTSVDYGGNPALEIGLAGARTSVDYGGNSGNLKSVLTIPFQFTFENHLRENVASMARQYVGGVVASVQRVTMALAPSRLGSHLGPRLPPGTPEPLTLARWVCQSYR